MKKIWLAMMWITIFLAGCGTNGQEASVPEIIESPEHNMPMDNAQEQKTDPTETESDRVTADPQKKYKLMATLQEDGDLISIIIDTDLAFSSEHYGQKHQYGEGHIHFYVNKSLKGPIMQNGPYQVEKSIFKDGANQIQVTLAGNDHSEPYNATVVLEFDKAKN